MKKRLSQKNRIDPEALNHKSAKIEALPRNSDQSSNWKKHLFDLFGAICHSEYGRAVAIARTCGLRNPMDAQAVAHEAMLSMEITLEECINQFIANLRSRVWSRAKGNYRQGARYTSKLEAYAGHLDTQPAEQATFNVEERLKQLEPLLNQLNVAQQQVLRLRLWEGFSVKRIARLLNLSANTVKSHCRRGAARLAQLLRE
jgi:RNA polymerase sigma factor (sigma-70 family)